MSSYFSKVAASRAATLLKNEFLQRVFSRICLKFQIKFFTFFESYEHPCSRNTSQSLLLYGSQNCFTKSTQDTTI